MSLALTWIPKVIPTLKLGDLGVHVRVAKASFI